MILWFRSDWINPFRPEAYNWIDFALIHISGEYDRRFGNIEFHVALLGFHVGGQWNIAKGDEVFKAELAAMVSELEGKEKAP